MGKIFGYEESTDFFLIDFVRK